MLTFESVRLAVAKRRMQIADVSKMILANLAAVIFDLQSNMT